MQTFRNRLPFWCAVAMIILLAVSSAAAKEAAAAALVTCGAALIPSLLPFYTAADLMLKLGLPPAGKVVSGLMRRVFCLPADAAAALALGLVGGYPVGAAATAALYRDGSLTKAEAVRLSAFANNAGPAFIIGAAGLTVFGSAAVGLQLYAVHAVSALLTGFLLCGERKRVTVRRAASVRQGSLNQALPEAVFAALQSILAICAYVTFFSAVLAAVKSLPFVQPLTTLLQERFPVGEAVLSGFCELSCGVLLLSGCPQTAAMIAASVLLGFGGICVYFQSAGVLSAAGLPTKQLLSGKLLQAAISGALTALFCLAKGEKALFLISVGVILLLFAVGAKIRTRKATHNLL